MQRLTVALGLWAAIGPIVGILLGHFLTRSSQHEQWILDNRKQEFRELKSALSRSFAKIQQIKSHPLLSGEQMLAIEDADADAVTTIRDRIFISFEVQELRVQERWAKIIILFSRNLGHREAHSVFNELAIDITVAALKTPAKETRPKGVGR